MNSVHPPHQSEREGRCLCGAVRFTAQGEPLRGLVCHCKACQRMTGTTGYAQAVYPVEAVRFSGEAVAQYAYTSQTSGKQVQVQFCPRCGSTLGLRFERWPAYCSVSLGALNEPDSVTISSHIWTRSAQAGVVLPAGVDCFAQARADLDGTPQVPERFDAPQPARGGCG